jgi:hypothetical protein
MQEITFDKPVKVFLLVNNLSIFGQKRQTKKSEEPKNSSN